MHKLASVRNPSFAMNHMAMLSLKILRVIKNAKLRELVAKGPKYRKPNRVNWKATETMFLESIDLYAKIAPKENKWKSNISLNGKTS